MTDTGLHDKVAEVIARYTGGARLGPEDALVLATQAPLGVLGWLAEREALARHGERVCYNVNLHLNLTNVCEADCFFCSFARLEEGMPEAKTFALDEIEGFIRQRLSPDTTEVHIVNGLHPGLPFDYYLDALRLIRQKFPQLHIKAFTAVEIGYYARKYELSVAAVLTALMDAGLGSLPGGGAEVFAPRVRKKICRNKVSGEAWLDIHRTAHHMGLRSNATLLFGTVETWEERIEHLLALRDLQDETGGFQAFIPLVFHNENNKLHKLKEPTAQEALRVVAVSRLLLDNFPHVKAYWATLGVPVAQMALAFGASDLDGTVVSEKIYAMAGADAPGALSVKELEELIVSAGRTPQRRDTLYRPVEQVVAGK